MVLPQIPPIILCGLNCPEKCFPEAAKPAELSLESTDLRVFQSLRK